MIRISTLPFILFTGFAVSMQLIDVSGAFSNQIGNGPWYDRLGRLHETAVVTSVFIVFL